MTREEAIKNIKKVLPMSKTLEDAFYTLHPELAESEDEKFREYIIRCCEECDNGLELSMSTTKRLLTYLKKQKEQKPAEWGDTDNIGWDEAFACVTRAEKAAKNEEELQNAVTAEKWLKEIKFKYCVHPVKQEWSEEDESFLDSIEEAISSYYDLNHAPQYHYWLEQKLKSLRPQIIDSTPLYTIEQVDEKIREAQEWSDEDERKYQCIRNILLTDVDKKVGSWKYSEILEWYEKRGIGRYTNSQPHWKPSEEHMKALEEVRTIFHHHHLWDEINPILYDYEELMRDLQKLL